jgi:Carbohydrate binding module (family 6)
MPKMNRFSRARASSSGRSSGADGGDGFARLAGVVVFAVSIACMTACAAEPSRCSSASPCAAGSAGSAGATTGAAGMSGGSPGTAGASGGAGTATAGTAGGAGAASAGAAGGAGTSGGSDSGVAGTNAAGGAGVDAGGPADAPAVDGPNQVPPDYMGKPLGGAPQRIPGKIEIENYDTGGEGVAYHDKQVMAHGQLCGVSRTDVIDLNCTAQPGSPRDKNAVGCADEPAGEEYLGYIGTGDWLRYTVTVAEAGSYVISGHEGVAGNNVQVMFTFTPTMKTGPVTLPATGGCAVEAYHVWATHNNLATIALQPGTYVMQLDMVNAAMNLDWFAFTKM